jgi:hypothetical protein
MGWMSERISLRLPVAGEVFFLDIPFYRTMLHRVENCWTEFLRPTGHGGHDTPRESARGNDPVVQTKGTSQACPADQTAVLVAIRAA